MSVLDLSSTRLVAKFGFASAVILALAFIFAFNANPGFNQSALSRRFRDFLSEATYERREGLDTFKTGPLLAAVFGLLFTPPLGLDLTSIKFLCQKVRCHSIWGVIN